MPSEPRTAFTWVELLALIAALSLLAAILLPSVLRPARTHGHRTITSSNLRQIGQASLIYANDNREELPGLTLTVDGKVYPETTTPNIHSIAAALARSGGLNDGSMWVAREDRHPGVDQNLSVVLDRHGPSGTLNRRFAASALSFQYIAGLDTSMPSTTPIAFTRGLQPDGNWAADEKSVFGPDGGHIVFLGGNVQYYSDTRENGGRLVDTEGNRTANILETVGPDTRIFSDPETTTGTRDGLPGEGTTVESDQ